MTTGPVRYPFGPGRFTADQEQKAPLFSVNSDSMRKPTARYREKVAHRAGAGERSRKAKLAEVFEYRLKQFPKGLFGIQEMFVESKTQISGCIDIELKRPVIFENAHVVVRHSALNPFVLDSPLGLEQ